jgi:hypothetical protein
MSKKLSALMSAAAIALLLMPAAAVASQITTSEGKALAVGSVIVGTSANTVIGTESFGTLSCGSVTTVGELMVNEGSFVEAMGRPSGSASTCLQNGKHAITLTDITFWNGFFLSSPSIGEVHVQFDAGFAGGILCEFAGEAAVTYTSGSSGIRIAGDEILGGVCGESSITASFALESGGKAVKLD